MLRAHVQAKHEKMFECVHNKYIADKGLENTNLPAIH